MRFSALPSLSLRCCLCVACAGLVGWRMVDGAIYILGVWNFLLEIPQNYLRWHFVYFGFWYIKRGTMEMTPIILLSRPLKRPYFHITIRTVQLTRVNSRINFGAKFFSNVLFKKITRICYIFERRRFTFVPTLSGYSLNITDLQLELSLGSGLGLGLGLGLCQMTE